MVSSWIRWFTLSLEAGPSFSIQVEIEEIIEVVATLPLVAPKEVKTVHECDASSARPLLWLISNRVDLRPSVLANTVSVQVIQAFIIICSSEQVNVSIREDALVPRPGREYLSLREHFNPLVDLHLFEVLIVV